MDVVEHTEVLMLSVGAELAPDIGLEIWGG
jgi:hypothetical protein